MKGYRLLFETVLQHRLVRYMNADPWYFSNVSQTVANSQVPDEDWYQVINETDDPWDQFWTLRKWAAEDAHFVRNVRLERLVVQPEWAEVSDADAVRLTADGL